MTKNHLLSARDSKTVVEPVLRTENEYRLNAYSYTPAADARKAEPDADSFAHYWRILGRHKILVMLMGFSGALLGYLLTLPQAAVYRATTSVEIQSLNEDFLNMKNVSPTAGATAFQNPEYNIRTQSTMLQSRPVLELALDSVPAADRQALIGDPRPSRLAGLRKILGLPQHAPMSDQERGLQAATDNLKVRSEPNSRVVTVSFDSTDPRLAADFANSLVTSFVQFSLEMRRQASQNTVEWLLQQMGGLKTKLKTAEQELQAFANSANLTIVSEKDNVAEERLRLLQADWAKAQADAGAKQARFERIAQASAESLPEVLDDPTLKDYSVDLTKLRRDLADASSTYTQTNPKVIKIKDQIKEVEAALDAKRANILSRIKNEYDSSRRYERLLNNNYSGQVGMMAKQMNKVSHYADLKREVDTTRALYDTMFQKVTEAGLASAMRASDIRVIEQATPPKDPYKPSFLLNTGFGLFSGLCFGIALIVQRARADRGIQGPGDTAFLNVPELGVIPASSTDRFARRLARKGSETLDVNGDEPERLELTTWQQQRSIIAESFRLTLTSILLSGQNGTHPRVLVLSSANPGEGKTTVISNLAIALAQAGQRVLLIDGDMRRPRLHGVFGVDNGVGLGEALTGKAPLAIHQTKIPNLSLLPSGQTEDTSLLFTPELRVLLRRLKTEYNMILIDTPPLLHMPDARLFSRHADAAILVIAQHTTRDAVGLACQKLAEDGSSLLGTILNNWNPKTSTHGYSQVQEYYQSYYRQPTT